MHYVRFLAAFLVYAVIDIAWNVSPIAQGMYKSLYEASGNDVLLDQFGRKMDTWGVEQGLALLAFFGLIALGNSYLAIEPALKENNLLKAVKNSFVLGCAAVRHLHRADLRDAEDLAHGPGPDRHPHRRPPEPGNLDGRHVHRASAEERGA